MLDGKENYIELMEVKLKKVDGRGWSEVKTGAGD